MFNIYFMILNKQNRSLHQSRLRTINNCEVYMYHGVSLKNELDGSISSQFPVEVARWYTFFATISDGDQKVKYLRRRKCWSKLGQRLLNILNVVLHCKKVLLSARWKWKSSFYCEILSEDCTVIENSVRNSSDQIWQRSWVKMVRGSDFP